MNKKSYDHEFELVVKNYNLFVPIWKQNRHFYINDQDRPYRRLSLKGFVSYNAHVPTTLPNLPDICNTKHFISCTKILLLFFDCIILLCARYSLPQSSPLRKHLHKYSSFITLVHTASTRHQQAIKYYEGHSSYSTLLQFHLRWNWKAWKVLT